MKKLIVFLGMIVFSLSFAYAQQEYTIADITTSGIQFLDPVAVINLSGLQKGEKITLVNQGGSYAIAGTELASAIRNLWKTGLFGDIRIDVTRVEGTEAYLNIAMSERPKISKITITGVPKGQATTLTEKIEAIRGKIASDVNIKNSKQTIKKYYADKGFYNAKIDISQKRDTLIRNSTELIIKIQRGKKVKVKNIIIEGNTAVSEKKLLRKMKTKEKRPYRIFSSSKFIESRFEEDKKKIITYYNAKGHRDARIVFDTFYTINPKRMNIRMQLEEGKKYYYRNINWEGNIKYTDEQLSQVLGIKKGDIYNQQALDQKLNFSQTETDISSLYLDDGYLFFRVIPIEVQVEGDSIDVEMRLQEGPQATIDKVIINGNTKTSDHVIQRELRTIPGQKFSRRNLIRTHQALSQMRYFDPEKIDINPVPHMETGTVDIVYNLEEKPSDMLEISGGWGGGLGFVGTLGVSFSNFSIRKAGRLSNWRPVPAGDGQQLSLRAQANGRVFQTYSISFVEPWLGGKKPNAFSVSLSYSQQNRYAGGGGFGINRLGERVGFLKILGASVGLGRRLRFPDDYFTLSNSINLQRYELNNFTFATDFFNTGVSTGLTLNTTIARNSIDNPTFPRSGSSVSLSVSLTPPYTLLQGQKDKNYYEGQELSERFKWLEYHKWMFDASFFTPVVGKLVINTRSHFGFLGSYTPALGIGPFERFVMGGAGLTVNNWLFGQDIIGLRGYVDNQVGEIDPRNPNGNAQAGTVFAKYVMELRYPLSLNPTATIYLITFLEGGNTWTSFDIFNPFQVRRAAGVGVRILMPMFGLLGLDYGRGLDPIPGRQDGGLRNFTFTLGQQIR